MAKVRKLTPQILKRIINEEKSKIKRHKTKKRRVSLKESKIDEITKLALLEVKQMIKLKKLRQKRNELKRKIASR